MDFFEEVTKQAAKIINNATTSISQISNLVGTSTDAMGKIVLLKNRVENLSRDVNKLYKKIGYLEVQHPDADTGDLIKEAKEKYEQLKNCEAEIENLKTTVIDTSQTTKESLRKNSQVAAEMLKKDAKEDSEKIKKEMSQTVQELKETLDSLEE